MNIGGNAPESSGGYGKWIGESPEGDITDSLRIHDQNSSLGRARWGVGQREFLHNLKETYQPEAERFQPRTWFELGVGPDAALVINALEEFGEGMEDKGLVMVEINGERLNAAKAKVREHFKERPDLLAKVDFDVEAGDAAEILRRYPKKADVIHAQLLFQHLHPDERTNILQACGERLNDNGLLIVADVTFDDWSASPSERGLARLRELPQVYRERRFISAFRRQVYRREGKIDFPDPQAIADMICQESKPTRRDGPQDVFEVLPGLTEVTQVPDLRLPQDRDEIAYLENIVTLASKGRRMKRRAAWFADRLTDPGRTEGIDYPSLARVVARRIPDSYLPN